MRNLMCLVVAAALLSLTAGSGKKESTTPTGGNPNVKEQIIGKWEYVSGEGDHLQPVGAGELDQQATVAVR